MVSKQTLTIHVHYAIYIHDKVIPRKQKVKTTFYFMYHTNTLSVGKLSRTAFPARPRGLPASYKQVAVHLNHAAQIIS